jgi:hypothetical protein
MTDGCRHLFSAINISHRFFKLNTIRIDHRENQESHTESENGNNLGSRSLRI